jgi:hypothetical protein
MHLLRLGTLTATLTLLAQVASAQQPAPPPPMTPGHPPMAKVMQTMDSMSARLDTLVNRMNRAKGDKKIAAMADVINELVAQRRMMQIRMHGMADSGSGMPGGMGHGAPMHQSPPATPGKPRTPADTAKGQPKS